MSADRDNSGHLVYVVDDNPLLGEVTAQIISSVGYQTRMYTDPVAANNALANAGDHPVLLVTDFDLGKMVGFELIETARKNHPGIKTLLVSGTVDPQVLAKHPVQPDKFLAKPFRSEELLGFVDELVNS